MPALRRALRWWIERNPTYLLSALVMLAGCYLVLDPWRPGARSAGDVWACFAGAQVYEAGLLLSLHVVVRRRGPGGQSRGLVAVAGIFLADGLFLSHSLQAVGSDDGALGGFLLLGLAAAKLAVMGRLVGEPWGRRLASLLLTGIAICLAMPSLGAAARDAGLPLAGGLELAAWALAAFAAAAGDALAREPASRSPHALVLLGLALGLAPLHAGASALVFSIPIEGRHVAPFLVAGAWIAYASGRDRRWVPALALALFLAAEGLEVAAPADPPRALAVAAAYVLAGAGAGPLAAAAGAALGVRAGLGLAGDPWILGGFPVALAWGAIVLETFRGRTERWTVGARLAIAAGLLAWSAWVQTSASPWPGLPPVAGLAGLSAALWGLRRERFDLALLVASAIVLGAIELPAVRPTSILGWGWLAIGAAFLLLAAAISTTLWGDRWLPEREDQG